MGWIWLRIWTSGGLLWTRYWTFGFYKMLGGSWGAAQLTAPQEGLSSVSKFALWRCQYPRIHMASNGILISRLRKMSKKAVVVYLELLFRHLFEWTGGNEGTTSQGRCFQDRDLKPDIPEYDIEVYSSRLHVPSVTFREDCHISESLSVASYHETETFS
jgi:hypothetical protein